MECRGETFEVLHIVFSVVGVFDECESGDESGCCCSCVLDSGDEYSAGVEALAMVPEDSCYSDGLPGADGAGHEGMVVLYAGKSIIILSVF